jgi:hypothetical protein
MSAKDVLLETIRGLPDSSNMDDLVRAINARFQRATDAEWTAEDVTEEDWRLFAVQGLADELADPREDIYTLEDGEPLHEPV